MQQHSVRDMFLESDPDGVDAHDYEPFHQGCIDVKLPVPNSDIRLFIFRPADYPYLWVKYLDGLQREYGRIGVGHILDMQTLNNPDSAVMGILAIIDGKIVAGMRFHGPIRKAEEASVYSEMAGGNQELLKQLLVEWIPEKVVEAKGLWLVTRHPARKRILETMTRSSVYGAALLGARYIPGTSPANIMKIYIEIGMYQKDEIGCVPYPTEDFQTTFGYCDLQHVFKNCTDRNYVLLRRDWQKIQQARLQSEQQRNDENTWLPIILDEANPFHAQALESLLTSPEYEQRTNFKSMQNELSELIPPVDETLRVESKRWIAYPWRKVALELIGPRSFRRLLRDRNRNKITGKEQEKLAALTVGVVGLSTGHVIAHTMVMEGVCGHMKLADFDTLEVSNLNRIPASLLDIGMNKAVIAARRIAELDPYLKVEIFDEGLQESNIDRFMDGLDLIIEECDSLDVKVLVREAAIIRKIPVLMSTSDLGMMDVERFDLDQNPKPFHGLADIKAAELKDLSLRDKSGYALAIVEGEKVSARLAASMIEIDHTVSSWSQLASDVTQGAALVTTAVRRIGTGKLTPSSRTRMDMDSVLEGGTVPVIKDIDIETSMGMPVFRGNVIDDMLLAAKFAPSGGNLQPWRIYWENKKLHLEVDRKRTTSADVEWRGAFVALGAATLNAEIVVNHYGVGYRADYLPIKSKPDLITRFTLSKHSSEDKKLGELYPYLLKRKTNRMLSNRVPLPVEVMRELSNTSRLFPVNLHTLSTPEQLDSYSDILAETDRIKHLSKHLHQEMVEELVWPGKNDLDEGIDVRTLGLGSKDLNVLPILKRKDVMEKLADWGGGKALGAYSRDRINCASAIVVLTVGGHSSQDFLEGGKALQHFWLVAEKNGVSVQPVSPVFLYTKDEVEINRLLKSEYLMEVGDLKKRFDNLFSISKDEYPILVLRLSFATDPDYRSLRRL